MNRKYRLHHERDLVLIQLCSDPKRVCDITIPAKPYEQCIHCKSMFHKWVECANTCLHCSSKHAHRRCPDLSVEHYAPGGFTMYGKLAPAIFESDGSNDFDTNMTNTKPSNFSFTGFREQQGTPSTEGDGESERDDDGESERGEVGLTTTKPFSFAEFNKQHAKSSFQTDAMSEDGELDVTSTKPFTFSFAAPISHRSTPSFQADTVSEASAPVGGMNAERAAMIAATPLSDSSLQGKKVDPMVGPERTGMNSVPLGRQRQLGTSQSAGGSMLTAGAPASFGSMPGTAAQGAPWPMGGATITARGAQSINTFPGNVANGGSYGAANGGPALQHQILVWNGLKASIQAARPSHSPSWHQNKQDQSTQEGQRQSPAGSRSAPTAHLRRTGATRCVG